MKSIRRQAHIRHLDELREFAEDFAATAGMDPVRVQRVALALEEAIVNVLHHAYEQDGGEIEMVCQHEGERLEFLIKDWGRPFDPLEHPSPDMDTPLEERQIGGLGIHFIKQMADKIEYTHDGQSNILMLGFDVRS